MVDTFDHDERRADVPPQGKVPILNNFHPSLRFIFQILQEGSGKETICLRKQAGGKESEICGGTLLPAVCGTMDRRQAYGASLSTEVGARKGQRWSCARERPFDRRTFGEWLCTKRTKITPETVAHASTLSSLPSD